MTDAGPPSKRTSRRAALIVILSSVACAAVIGFVVWAARNRAEPEDRWARARDLLANRRSPLDFDPEATRRRDPELAGCSDLDPERPPKLVFELEGDQLDFGKVKQDVRVTMPVPFRNDGQSTLCILRVETGCGCLKAHLASRQRRFQPGESGVINVELDSSAREGVVKKSISVTTNELAAPIRQIRARCDISLAVIASPPAIRFGRHSRGLPAHGATSLRSPVEDAAWTVTKVEGTRLTDQGRRVEYTFDVKAVPDPRYRKLMLIVHHPGLEQDGEFRDPLIVHTTHPERRTLSIQSFLEILPRIRAEPARVSLGFIRSGATRPPTNVRVLSNLKDVTFEITGVHVEPRDGRERQAAGEGFEVTFGMDGASRGWVDVRYDGKTRKPGLLEAVVVVETSDERMPELRIPVSATIRRAR